MTPPEQPREVVDDDARAFQLRAACTLTGYATFAWRIGPDTLAGDHDLGPILGARIAHVLREGNALSSYLQIVHRDDVDAVRSALADALRPGGPDFRTEHRIVPSGHPGMPERWISWLGCAQFDRDGRPHAVCGVVADITEQRIGAELRLRQQKFEAIATLTSGIAHDFNNVIGAIVGYADVAAAEHAAGQSPVSALDEIKRGARRAAEVVHRLSDYSRDQPPRHEAFGLAEVFEEACALMQPAMGPLITLACEAGAPLPTVMGDPTELHQVAVNLITNARQAMDGRSGAIGLALDEVALGATRSDRVQVLPAGTYVRAQITDDGPGIAAELMSKIFDPFFTTKPPGEGTGVGLAAVQGIVRRHGGVITAENRVGGGALFTLYLPEGRSDDTSDPPPETRATHPGPRLRRKDSPRVLFVDDEPTFVDLARRVMPGAGCDVDALADPTRALERFELQPDAYDVLITDFAMPVLTGLQLVARVREIRPDLPVVLTSGHLSAEDRELARRLGITAIVPKPCSMHRLVDEARRVAA